MTEGAAGEDDLYAVPIDKSGLAVTRFQGSDDGRHDAPRRRYVGESPDLALPDARQDLVIVAAGEERLAGRRAG